MIYFLKANDRVKIGYSHDPVSRIASLQTSSSYDLETLLLIDGTLDEEKELHTKFSMKRRSGEWFELDEELQLFIDTNMVHDRRYEFGLGPNVDFSGREQIKRLRLKHNMTGIKLAWRVSGYNKRSDMPNRKKRNKWWHNDQSYG